MNTETTVLTPEIPPTKVELAENRDRRLAYSIHEARSFWELIISASIGSSSEKNCALARRFVENSSLLELNW